MAITCPVNDTTGVCNTMVLNSQNVRLFSVEIVQVQDLVSLCNIWDRHYQPY